MYCCVPGCSNTNRNNNNGLRFFRFPKKQPAQKSHWEMIALGGKLSNENSRICSCHFKEDQFLPSGRLKHDSVPTIFDTVAQKKAQATKEGDLMLVEVLAEDKPVSSTSPKPDFPGFQFEQRLEKVNPPTKQVILTTSALLRENTDEQEGSQHSNPYYNKEDASKIHLLRKKSSSDYCLMPKLQPKPTSPPTQVTVTPDLSLKHETGDAEDPDPLENFGIHMLVPKEAKAEEWNDGVKGEPNSEGDDRTGAERPRFDPNGSIVSCQLKPSDNSPQRSYQPTVSQRLLLPKSALPSSDNTLTTPMPTPQTTMLIRKHDKSRTRKAKTENEEDDASDAEEVSDLSDNEEFPTDTPTAASKKDYQALLLRMEKLKAKNQHLLKKLEATQRQLRKSRKNVKMVCAAAAGKSKKIIKPDHLQAAENLKNIFKPDQIRALIGKVQKLHAWSDETLATSLRLRKICSRPGYNELLRLKYPLPSHRTLERYSRVQRNKNKKDDGEESSANIDGPSDEETRDAEEGNDPPPVKKQTSPTKYAGTVNTAQSAPVVKPPPPVKNHEPGGVYMYKVGGGYCFGPLPDDKTAPKCPIIRQRKKRFNASRKQKTLFDQDNLTEEEKKKAESESVSPAKKKRQETGFDGGMQPQIRNNPPPTRINNPPPHDAYAAYAAAQLETAYQLQHQSQSYPSHVNDGSSYFNRDFFL